MGFRFWRRFKIAPGITLNLSKSGGSLSFGPRGAKFTIGRKGPRTSLGIPGTGLFYTKTYGSGNKSKKARKKSSHTLSVLPKDRLTLGFFRRLITPDDEEALVDGCRELVLGNEDKAFHHLRNAKHLADGAFLAGFLAFQKGQLDEAIEYFNAALENYRRLGRYFSKYGISALMSLPITDHISAHAGPDVRGILLALVEVYQRKKKWNDALECLERLHSLEPDDVLVKLSTAELLMEIGPKEKKICRRILQLSNGVENESEIHAALLLYKAKALRSLGLNEAASDVLTKALRRKKNRSHELLQALRYERAKVYEDLGHKKRAQNELERIYAEDPNFEDVAEKLGLEVNPN
jgi:tetratricopeptide (TPR) repeat protein